jgi:hypothetical protein
LRSNIEWIGCRAGSRFGSPQGRRDRGDHSFSSGVGGQGGNHDHPYRLSRREDPVQLGLVATLARPRQI